MASYKGPLLRDLRGAKKQQRISQLAASPATRKAIPDDLLPLVYRKAREQAVYGKQPAAPGSPLTNADVARQANAATQLQYGAQDRLLQRQQAQGPDYYQAYLDELKKSQAGALSQGQQTGQAIQQLYGSGPMAPGSNQATLGQAQGGTAALLGQVEANHQAALMNAVQSGKLKFLAGLGLQRADLEQTKGAFNVEQRAKIKQQAGTDAATAALANVHATTAATSAQTAQQRAQETHRHNVAQENKPPSASDRKTAADLAFFRKHGYYPPTGPPKAPKGPNAPKGKPRLTGTQANKYVSQATQVASMLLHPPTFQPTGPDGKPKGKPRPATHEEILADIRAGTSSLGKGIDPRVINLGSSLASNRNQGIGPFGEGQAQSLGIPKGRFKRVKKSKAKPKRPIDAVTDAIGNVTTNN